MLVTQTLKPGKLVGALMALVLSLGLFGSLSVGAAPSAEAKPVYAAVCGQRTWTGKDPSLCTADYTLYDLSQDVGGGHPKIILFIKTSNPTTLRDMWRAVKHGVAAANTYCNSHSLTCGVVTAVGVAVAAPYVQAALG